MAFIIVMMVFAVTACEDQPPTEYVPRPFLEAYLLVGEPIDNITVAVSQPLTEPFDYSRMMVADAEVVVTANGVEYPLTYTEQGGIGHYRFRDTTYLVQPETRYGIHVRMRDGSVMSAETTTPQRIDWITPPRDVLQYPQDTTVLVSPDSLRISWSAGNTAEYIIRVKVLDTLGYGIYLDPATSESNERTNNLMFEDPESPAFYSTARWGFIQTSQAPTVWAAFRWFGRNEVAILAADKALLDWFKSTQWGGASVEYRAEYSNVKGGIGVFGSAAVISRELFLLKRKKA